MAITCPKCKADNPDTKQFCGDCGTQLIPLAEADPSFTKTLETPVSELTRGTTFAGRYEIIEELGSGGMGRVYRVEDTKLKQEVALKLIKPEIAKDKKTIERFRNELKIARNIRHKNVCGMYDLGETGGAHFITMEYVRGEDLKSLIRRIGQLPIGKSVSIAKQICEGLSEAHKLGVVHRDLKPNNIMIDGDGNVRIMDFGIARSVEGKGITGSGIMIGTPDYMSPEQAEGKVVDQKSDIYSLGIILYEMAAGKLPFEGDTPLSVAMKHKGEIPKSPIEYNAQIPDELNLLILKCLEKDKSQRFESADQVLLELEKIERSMTTTEKGPIPSKRPSTVRQVTAGRKRPVMISAAVLAVAVLALAYILFLAPKKTLTPPQLLNPTTITTSMGIEDYPTFSPEGGRLAYESDQSGNWDIWISDIKSGVSANLTEDYEGDDRCPSWSPDGSQIAFLSTRDGAGCFVMSHLGGNVRKVAPLASDRVLGPSISRPVWSGDSSRLAFFDTHTSGLYFFIKTIDLEGGSTQDFSLPGPNMTGIDITMSPDGQFIAYVDTLHPDTDVSQIWMIRVSAGEGFPFTDADFIYKNPFWSLDGEHIYFMSNRGGGNDLWRQGVDSTGHPVGEPQPISTGLELKHFSFSKDGSKFAYSSGREITNIWRIPILEGRPANWEDAEQLTAEQIYVGQVEVTPDGKKILLDRRLRGIRALWMLDLESGEMQQLTTGRPREHVVGRLSTDGTKVVYHMPGLNNVNIWAFSIADRQTWQVTDEKGWNGNPCWSPDGQHIAFVSNRSGSYDIWIVPEKGGEAVQLTKHPDIDAVPRWSPDGKWVLFYSTRTGSGQIWKIPPSGGDPEPVTNPGVTYGTAWSLDGKHIYFVRDSNIWQVSADGKNERPIADFEGIQGRSQFPLSTDGKYIYFDMRQGSGDIWVMDVEIKK